jgi:hypothetical protein
MGGGRNQAERLPAALLAIDGDDALLGETRAAALRISAALPDETMRHRFQNAEAVRALGKLNGPP